MNLSIEWDIARATMGVSWLQIAKDLNCNRKTLYSMVNSKNPTLSTLEKLGSALNVDYCDVIKSAENKVKNQSVKEPK